MFNLSISHEAAAAKLRFDKLSESGSVIELKEKKRVRSLNQNSYLHVCIALYAIEFGYTMAESKTILKRECPFMRYEKNGLAFLKETSRMDTGELTQFVDWIRNYSSQNGLYIPSSEEYLEAKFSIDKEIEKHKSFL